MVDEAKHDTREAAAGDFAGSATKMSWSTGGGLEQILEDRLNLRGAHMRCRYSALQLVVGARCAQQLKITISRLKIDSAFPHQGSYASPVDSAS
jgi:hypothetical protein